MQHRQGQNRGLLLILRDFNVDLSRSQGRMPVFARHSDPRITTRYDRGRQNLDRHAAHFLSAFIAGAA